VSNVPIAAPTLGVLFDEIARGKDWVPFLPERYLAPETGSALPPTTLSGDAGSVISGITGSSQSTGGSNPQGRAAAASGDAPKVEYNLEYQDRFQKYKELSLPTRLVKAYCVKHKIKLPWNHAIKKAICISFHVKGVCNNRCGSSLDHKRHTKQQDDDPDKWLQDHYCVAAPSASSGEANAN
jgi:hypothetical protein